MHLYTPRTTSKPSTEVLKGLQKVSSLQAALHQKQCMCCIYPQITIVDVSLGKTLNPKHPMGVC